jgi:hypothetical protein
MQRSKTYLLVGLACILGCQSRSERPAPDTFPVTGTVIAPDNLSVKHATVEFTPSSGDKTLSALGTVDATGKFRLAVVNPDRNIPGAPTGVYRVTITLPLNPDRTGGQRYELPDNFNVKPRENEFTLELPVERK